MSQLDQKLYSILHKGLQDLKIELPLNSEKKLFEYLALMEKWNRAYNLTAITDPENRVVQHLLDSLAVHPFLQDDRIIDIGTGAGLPGLPLAVANPDRHFTLLDSNGKKIRFLQQVLYELEISNITLVNERSENYHPEAGFACITSRAFASLALMIRLSKHLLMPGGRFLAMKGSVSVTEIEAIETGFTIREMRKLTVPGLNAERHLVILEESHRG